MVFKSSNANEVASLELSLAAMKSLNAEYLMRAKQAEEFAKAATEGLDMQQLSSLIWQHVQQRTTDRVVHQQAVLQSTTVALNAALQSDDLTLRSSVNKVVQEITRSLSIMNEMPRPKV